MAVSRQRKHVSIESASSSLLVHSHWEDDEHRDLIESMCVRPGHHAKGHCNTKCEVCKGVLKEDMRDVLSGSAGIIANRPWKQRLLDVQKLTLQCQHQNDRVEDESLKI